MAVTSKVTINKTKIAQLSKAAITALEQTVEALRTEVSQAQVMPRDTGAMQNEKTFVDCSKSEQGIVSLITEGPYARRLFYHPEYNFKTSDNPNAKGRWLEDWMKGGKNEKFIPQKFAELYKRVAQL